MDNDKAVTHALPTGNPCDVCLRPDALRLPKIRENSLKSKALLYQSGGQGQALMGGDPLAGGQPFMLDADWNGNTL